MSAPDTLIYSGEHHAYWRRVPGRSGGNGYTENPFAAGLWTWSDAERETAHCGPEKRVELRLASEWRVAPSVVRISVERLRAILRSELPLAEHRERAEAIEREIVRGAK